MKLKLIVCTLALLAADSSEQAQRSAQVVAAPAHAGAKAPAAQTEQPTTDPAAQQSAEVTEQSAEAPAQSVEATEQSNEVRAQSNEAGEQPADKAAGATASPDTKAGDGEGEPDELLPIEANIISYTNQERQRYGLPPLEVDRRLMLSARRHCAWMARRHALVHTSQPVAENIAMGQRHSHEAVRDWMNSPGHRANILNRNHRRIGVAAYRTPSGTIFWCQQFGR